MDENNNHSGTNEKSSANADFSKNEDDIPEYYSSRSSENSKHGMLSSNVKPPDGVSANRLPLPKWVFVLLGIPTFYMPLAFLLMVLWGCVSMILGKHLEPPDWLAGIVFLSLYGTFALWPIYAAWVVFSKRLSLREKVLWLFLVTWGNMIGMACFYIFILRRYLGLEGRTGPRDEAALVRFLSRQKIDREELAPGQLGVLRSHFRNARQAKWGALAMLPMATMLIYMAIVIIPKNYYRLSSNFTPTCYVIVDREKDTKEEIKPDEESIKVFMQLMLTFGASAGVFGMCGFLFAMNAANLFFLNIGRQKLLVDFLKARKIE